MQLHFSRVCTSSIKLTCVLHPSLPQPANMRSNRVIRWPRFGRNANGVWQWLLYHLAVFLRVAISEQRAWSPALSLHVYHDSKAPKWRSIPTAWSLACSGLHNTMHGYFSRSTRTILFWSFRTDLWMRSSLIPTMAQPQRWWPEWACGGTRASYAAVVRTSEIRCHHCRQ